jgi:hypothetical protein
MPRRQRNIKLQISKKHQKEITKASCECSQDDWCFFGPCLPTVALAKVGFLVLFSLVPVLAFIQTLKKLPGFPSHFSVKQFILHFIHEVAAIFRGLKYHRQYLLASFEEKHIAAKATIGFWLFFATQVAGQFGYGPGIGGSDHITHRIGTRHIERDYETVTARELLGNRGFGGAGGKINSNERNYQ